MRPQTAYQQQGAASVLAVILLAVTVFTLLLFSLRASQTGIHGTLAQQDSIEALFFAESGLERVAQMLGNGATCDATLMTTHTIGGGGFNISAIATTDFDGVTALPASQCRVQVTGTINNSNARRVIEAIADSGVSGSGSVLTDGGFDNAALWDTPALISGSTLNYTRFTANTQSASLPNGLVTISPPPGVVAIDVQFDYVISGTVNVRIRIERSSGGPININNGLTGTGTVSVPSAATLDPNTITLIEIRVTGISGSETVSIDNLFVGPSAGPGSSPAQIVAWREVP